MAQESTQSSSTSKGFLIREIPEEDGRHSQPQVPNSSGSDYEDLGDLPHSYGEDIIYLIAQEPHWLFCYWDIQIGKHPGGPTWLRCCLESGAIEAEIEVPFETRNWYIPVKQADTGYCVEIGYYRAEGWHSIARSVTVQTPAEAMAATEDFAFATIPFHLSFQRLVENVESALKSGQQLMTALAHMQRIGDFSAFGAKGLPAFLSGEQLALLEKLLGPALLEELASAGLSSGEMEKRIKSYLDQRLNSEGASEMLARIEEVTSMSSFFQAPALSASGETLGSWTTAGLSSWAAAAISSWSSLSSASAFSSASETTNWSSAGAASWAQAIASSWLQAAISSWSQQSTETSSGSLVSMSSWLQALQSSWAQAALSSWNQTALASWSSAPVSSWGGSEAVSSFGAPIGQPPSMHIEVIFSGGTDPGSRVTIGGKPVELAPDGSFRCHVKIPDANYEIPVVAESPEGVEIRRATLKFSH